MKITKCDSCGKEIAEREEVKIQFYRRKGLITYAKDICKECMIFPLQNMGYLNEKEEVFK